ncbi:MAG: ribonuclease Y [Planctomycetes bacterium]|nr:ribonuclease Y [Planctomycetota bacterium]
MPGPAPAPFGGNVSVTTTLPAPLLSLLAQEAGGMALIFVAAVLCLAAFLWGKSRIRQALDEAQRTLDSARDEKEKIIKEAHLKAREEAFKQKEAFEKVTSETRDELKQVERKLDKREDLIDRKTEASAKKERELEQRERLNEQKQKMLDEKGVELQNLIENARKQLHEIAGLSREEATRQVLSRIETELQTEISSMINKHKDKVKEVTESEARETVTIAIQRIAAAHTADTVVSTVDLPNEEMKGRIIGREGRNIRAFERATGIDVIVDDTPGVIVVSGFDSVRREMARRAMEKLIHDGRIHPTRIEELVEHSKKEMEEHIQQTGKQACYDLDIHGLHPKVITLLGRLRYRTSYGQNVLQHSMEVAWLSSAIAAEVKLDAKLAKRCGLLHDIGKAVDQEMEGSHPAIGAELLKRFDERPEVVDAAGGHHGDMNPEFPYTVITAAADAISASRPGARMETLEKYIKRMERLEAIANSYPGVECTFAIQAGREIRVLVNSQKIDDKGALVLARDIANDIEAELNYPGEIKVTVIREMRVVEYAR